MNLTHTAFRMALGMSLVFSLACGGGSSSSPAASAPTAAAPAPQLVYTDATSGTVRLVQDASLSTATHLVLDVMGTDATKLSAGLFMTLNVEPAVAQWTKVQSADTALVQNGAVYNLGTGVPLIKAKATGGTLTLVVGQKGYNSAVPTNGVLARVALDLQPGASSGLAVFNTSASGNKLLTGSGTLTDFAPGIGALKVQ
jgi:hypothetical protein